MTNKGILNNAFSKIALSFLLVISMLLPFIAIPNAQAATVLTVDEAISQFDVNSQKPATVEGYIVGFVASETSVISTATGDTNYAIAATPGETNRDKMLYVQLVTADHRAKFGLKTTPANLGKKVLISGSLEKYFGSHAGLKTPTSMEFVVEGGPTKVNAVTASPASSAVAVGTTVTLTTTTSNAKIYFTTNGVNPTTSDSVYANPFTINAATTIKAIAVDNKGVLTDSDVATFTYTIAGALTIAGARTAIGETVQIEGIVTTNPGPWGSQAFYMQDETAGMFVYATSANVEPGDKIKVTGKVITYSNEVEIENPTIEVISSGNGIPAAQIVQPSGVNEDTQGELVTLKNVTIKNLAPNGTFGSFEFQAVSESGEEVRVWHDNRTGITYNDFVKLFKEGDKVNITGIAAINGAVFQLKTLGLKSFDLVNKPAVYSLQYEGTVPVNTKIELKSGIVGAEIYYTLNGSTPSKLSTKYDTPIVLPTGTTTIKAIAVSGTTESQVFNFTYTIIKADGVIIREIQGKGHISPYVGASVTDVTGVVTYLIDGTNFVMQDVDNADNDNTTSEAIQVNKSSHGVKVGDKVKVTGTVAENGGGVNLSTTRINATQIIKDGTANLPAPLVVGVDIFPPNKIIDNDNLTSFDPLEDGIDFWESVEFMRLSFPNAKVVGPSYNGATPIVVESTTNNEFNLLGGLNIAADDYNPEKIFLTNTGLLDISSGDHFNGNVIGVISYTADGYRVLPEALPTLVKGSRIIETTHIVPTEDKLTIASYNIENFSNDKSKTSDEKVLRIAKSFVNNMKSPDIITLIEVQDNDGEVDSGNTDATESYERLIAAITEAGGPTYKWTDVAPKNNDNGGAPGGNIRVGYLYNPDRVSLVEGKKGTSSEGNRWDAQGNLALNPGVLDPTKFSNTRKPIAAQFDFKGEKVVVIGAHLNSKGGDQSLWGSAQPPVLSSEVQRHKLATTVNEFIKDGLAKDSNLNIVLAGDMNDFEFTKTLEILKGNEMTNMVDKVPANDRFSYFFQGNNQVLDHVLVSKHLENKTVADMIHINANYTEAQGRASDHDPVLIQMDLKAKDVVTPIAPDKLYDFKNLTTKKLTINKPSISLTLDTNTTITNGILFTGHYAEFHGEGFANKTVTIKPLEAGGIIDFKGTTVQKVIIDGNNVKEIRGAENIKEIEFINVASKENIKFTDKEGNLLTEVLFVLYSELSILY
ncbi:FN3 associated domain-containing protein [Psychrobacillus sp. L4]|uniref:FN3 associated domain-containing protein n=1 Tax=Psychrobacillus sp. L4 TaxID=3236892 RepID=UPI0036F3ED0A